MARRDEYNGRKRSSQRVTTDRTIRPSTSSSNSINTPDHRSCGLSSPTEIVPSGQGSQARDQGSETFTPIYTAISPPPALPHIGFKKRKNDSRKSSEEIDRGGEERRVAPQTDAGSEGQPAISLPVQVPGPPLSYGGKTPLPYVEWPEGDHEGMLSTYFPLTPSVGPGGKDLVAPPARPTPLSVKTELKGVSRLHFHIGVVSDVIYFAARAGKINRRSGDW